MENFNLTKDELQALYREELNDILEQCDWITYVKPELICLVVSNVMNKKGYDVPCSELYELYDTEVKRINVSPETWQKEFGIEEIISIIYDILLKNF